MNTNQLKKFAQAARKKLMEQVAAKLEFVLHTDSAALREKADSLKQLQEAINTTSKAQVIDKVAYTWFNRLMALRFMDVNDYQPIGIRVVTPKDGYTLPEILEEVKHGHISDELHVNRNRLFELLDGKVPSPNPQNEVYKELLISACNHLNKTFPFLFERINDYTELLMPDDLISQYSIIQDVIRELPAEDCQEVEIIGWLYQYYISELNDELISSKKVYKKDELAPASQLFTPKWIVQYIVDNTLGQLWSEIYPNTKILSDLQFYIKPAYTDKLEKRDQKSIEDIKFFDPCTGSGHVLSYAFDVFYKIYEELGYDYSLIPELIITKNLWGVDIDQRAAQLASFVLLMKGRQKYRRFLNKVEKNRLKPNVSFYQDFENDEKFKNASALGSLIKVEPDEYLNFRVESNDLFSERNNELKFLYQLLGQRYELVVTNPPYIGSSRMEGSVKQYVELNYPDTKSDLFATFVLRCLELCKTDGLTGYMTPFVWMFISSYEKLRTTIINHHFINNLIQLEYSGFDGATVPICTFTLRNNPINEGKGSYIRLSDFKGSENQAPKTLEAIQNPKCGWYYTANQKDFEKIPGVRIGYWATDSMIKAFEDCILLNDLIDARIAMATANNELFIRKWSEVSKSLIGINNNSIEDFLISKRKWLPCNKGGDFRKWYGNNENIVFWENNGERIKTFIDFETGRIRSHNYNGEFGLKESLTWSALSSSNLGIRYSPQGFLFVTPGSSAFIKDNNYNIKEILAYLTTKVAIHFLKIYSSTMNIEVGNILGIPFITTSDLINNFAEQSILISKQDWDSRETSWDFMLNELIRCKSNCGQNCADLDMLDDEDRNEVLGLKDIPTNSHLLEDCYQAYKSEWRRKFLQLHRNEEELNRQFIEIYGLQDELTPDVPLEDITILKEETSIVDGELVFHADEVFAQFVSYAVGCMFGRYSLDKEGLILANQGETLQDYLQKVELNVDELAFVPDKDNIIPILDDEWFEDDVVGRFHAFLKASFGKENFDKNLAFVQESLGMDMRKYFTKQFYSDHIKRYKKRPIYWQFSSPKGSFNVLIYMHRYTPDTLNQILNGYLREYKDKISAHMEHLDHIIVTGSSSEATKATKQRDKYRQVLLELQEYERDILYPLATERIAIDLDDGVLVNYNKFGKAIKEVAGLNDKVTKKKVKEFDWINGEEIR